MSILEPFRASRDPLGSLLGGLGSGFGGFVVALGSYRDFQEVFGVLVVGFWARHGAPRSTLE